MNNITILRERFARLSEKDKRMKTDLKLMVEEEPKTERLILEIIRTNHVIASNLSDLEEVKSELLRALYKEYDLETRSDLKFYLGEEIKAIGC